MLNPEPEGSPTIDAEHLTEHGLLATFSEARTARRAIEELGRAGIGAEEMSAGGRSLEPRD